MRIMIKKRILPLIVCFSILLSAVAYRPQKADAIAITSTAAIATGIAAIMTACGVTYWANSQQDAIDYITGKVSDYFNTLTTVPSSMEDWLGVTGHANLYTVVAGGAMRFTSSVASKILDFVSWLNQDEGIQSGGTAITDGGYIEPVSIFKADSGVTGSMSPAVVGNNTIRITITNVVRNGGSSMAVAKLWVALTLPDNTSSVSFSTTADTNLNYTAYTAKYVDVGDDINVIKISQTPSWSLTQTQSFTLQNTNNYNTLVFYFRVTPNSLQNGTVDLNVNGYNMEIPATYSITPSQDVSVPSIIEGDTLDVVPSVSLTSGSSVDDATISLLDGITSVNGLSASNTVAEVPSSGWEWLQQLLESFLTAITSLPEAIWNRFVTVLNDIKTGVTSIVNGITVLAQSIYERFAQVLQDIKTGISSLADSIYAKFTQILQDVKTGVSNIYNELAGIGHDVLGLPAAIAQSISNAFVPSADFADTFAATAYAMFDNHFSILSYPFSILGEFSTRLLTLGTPQPIFRWGNIKDPFSNKIVISAGQYNLNDALQNQKVAEIYDLYMLLVKAFISFQFINFLYAWFCDVFKMRESDYPLPFDDADGDSDVEDGDGYDGYYSSY